MKKILKSRLINILLLVVILLVSLGMFAGKPIISSLASYFQPTIPRSLGVAVDGFPGQVPTLLDSYASLVGEMPATAEWYVSMSDPFNEPKMTVFASRGVMPLISAGNPSRINDAQIASGAIDNSLHAFAQAAAAWKKPFFYRLDWEMNGVWMGFGPGQNGNTNQSFIAMWQHVFKLFRQDGATNALFVFSPNMMCAGACRDFAPMYPGQDYVDWVGLDGYNWGNLNSYSRWDSFLTIFGSSYNKLVNLAPGKPVMIAETGCTEQGGNKADWITKAFFDEIPNNFPMLKLIVWFDFNKETDWRINSSSATLQAYRNVVASPSYQVKLISSPNAPNATSTSDTSIDVPAHPKATPSVGATARPSVAVTPTPVVTSTPGSSSTPTPTPAPSTKPQGPDQNTGTGTTTQIANSENYATSFEDGTVDNWGRYDTSVTIQNSTDFAYDGSHSLKVSYHNVTKEGYHQTDLSGGVHDQPSPLAGQTLTAYVYVPAGSPSVSAHIYVEDNYHKWHADPVVPLTSGQWTMLTYTVPDDISVPTYHMGVQFVNKGGLNYSGTIYVDTVKWVA